MTLEAVAELDALLKDDPLPPPTVTQEGEPDRMTTVYPQIVAAYVATVLHARTEP